MASKAFKVKLQISHNAFKRCLFEFWSKLTPEICFYYIIVMVLILIITPHRQLGHLHWNLQPIPGYNHTNKLH